MDAFVQKWRYYIVVAETIIYNTILNYSLSVPVQEKLADLYTRVGHS